MRLVVRAHAKINWALGVRGVRGDGYHELDMLLQRIALSDELSFERARRLTLEVDGRPGTEHNLVLRAANALNDALGNKLGAHITLRKRIPSRAGLGGGSADCAATLLALNRLWDMHLPLRTLMRLGLKLGADVPYCLQGGYCRVQGKGEVLIPLSGAPALQLMLFVPGGGLSTPAVFRALDAGPAPAAAIDIPALARALAEGELSRAQALSRNDLEKPAIALMPEIGSLMDRLRALGCPYVRMSGSGSTVFAAFSDAAQARALAAMFPEAILTRTLAEGEDEQL